MVIQQVSNLSKHILPKGPRRLPSNINSGPANILRQYFQNFPFISRDPICNSEYGYCWASVILENQVGKFNFIKLFAAT